LERDILVLARVEQTIGNVKVDIPLVDVKSELGIEFIPRRSTLIVFWAGRLEQIDQEIIRSWCLHQATYAEHKERVANIISSGDYHAIPMGGPPNK
jgi:hypothetical protein